MVNTKLNFVTSSPSSAGMMGCEAQMCRPVDLSAACRPSTANYHLRRANNLVARHDITAAISAFSQALIIDAKSIPALIGRAGVFLALNSHNLALRDLTRAIALDSGNTHALALRAEVYVKIASVSMGNRDVMLTLALDDASEALRLDPESSSAAEVRANVYDLLDADTIFSYRRQSNAPAEGAKPDWESAVKNAGIAFAEGRNGVPGIWEGATS